MFVIVKRQTLNILGVIHVRADDCDANSTVLKDVFGRDILLSRV
jgi:hypothetical protein